MKYILLETWAKKNKVNPIDAKNWCRRGKLPGAKKQIVRLERWVIPEDFKKSQIKSDKRKNP